MDATEYSRQWRAAHPGYANAHNRAARQANLESYREVEARWREANREKLRASSKEWRDKHPEHKESLKSWWANNKEKASAYRSVARAIKAGQLHKEPCEVCGDLSVEAHHDDYSKPLCVRWLCRKHHSQTRSDACLEERHGR